MKFNRLIDDSKGELKKNISSRRENISVTFQEFNTISKKYFNNISKDKNLIIKFDKDDKETLVFVLRWYYNLWIDLKKDYIEVYSSFPKEFEIVSEVNKLNHPHTPKTFEKGTKMFYNSSNYSSCNWLKGIPLWDNKDEEVVEGLKPSCQINYNFVKSILT
tara:strand:- start:2349 stop:2831 length:483 start_codon:yes stop_codon:yes gene_type:complete